MNKIRKHILLPILLAFALGGCTMLVDSEPANKIHTWKQRSTANIDIFYLPDSPAERDIEQIATVQQQEFERVVATLSSSYSGPIQIYLYTSQSQSSGLSESKATGLAHPEVESVEAIYSNNTKSIGRHGVAAHEMVHVVASISLAKPDSRVLSEGLAVAMDNYWRAPQLSSTRLHSWSDFYIKSETMPSLTGLSDKWDRYPSNLSYPVSGSYVSYLLNEYGMKRFKEFYIRSEEIRFTEALEQIYGRSFEEVEQEWRSYVSK